LAVAFWLQLIILLCSLYNWTLRLFSFFPIRPIFTDKYSQGKNIT